MRQAPSENYGAIHGATIAIDDKAETIEKEFPKAKKHTEVIKKQTPIIRSANYEQEKQIQELKQENNELKEQSSRNFKWFICSILFISGAISCYLGVNKFGTKFTITGALMAGGSISAFYYWQYIQLYFLPICILYGIVNLVMLRREKDLENIEKGV